jgi:hypothetical protein
MRDGQSTGVQRAFTEHLNGFAASLPSEEQLLLKQLLALAAVALDVSSDEVQGYLDVPYSTAFFAGLIREIGFPAVDAASKDAAKLSL